MLSIQLYQFLESLIDEPLVQNKRASFLWIWRWLFMAQSPDVIQHELDTIQEVLQSESNPQIVMELAWKAEALEKLLS
ncbi:MAG: hypothetical protein H6673_11455 [Anaerolineales bacterium]|nr:hypothetical protein [Anaerolineales bacterium]